MAGLIARQIYEHYFGYVEDRRFMVAKKREIDAWLGEGYCEGDFEAMSLDDLILEWGKIESQTWGKLAAQAALIPGLRLALEALLEEYCDLVQSEFSVCVNRDPFVIAARAALKALEKSL